VGVIAVDYEFTDYNAMNMKGTGENSSYNYDIENETIDKIYRGTHRVSAGMEWRVAKIWYLRGGAMYQQSPFIDGVANNDPTISFNGGIGYRNDYFFIDLAAGYQTRDQIYYMYKTDETLPTSIQTKALTTMLSLGFRY
jgi:long-subunit fatty acid transport protein